MILAIIVAMSENSVIGRRGKLPWHITEDLQRFKRLTMGHHLVMGRKTFESIGRPLPGRTSIVVTRGAELTADGVLTAGDVDHAIRLAEDDSHVFVIGGAQIYRLALPLADRMYVTRVFAELDGDAVFGPVNWEQWQLVEESKIMQSSSSDFAFRFQIFDRLPRDSSNI